MTLPSSSTTTGAVVGAAGFSFPLWDETLSVLTGANQILIAALGLVVLVLTARKLWIDTKIATRRLRDLEQQKDKPK